MHVKKKKSGIFFGPSTDPALFFTNIEGFAHIQLLDLEAALRHTDLHRFSGFILRSEELWECAETLIAQSCTRHVSILNSKCIIPSCAPQKRN